VGLATPARGAARQAGREEAELKAAMSALWAAIKAKDAAALSGLLAAGVSDEELATPVGTDGTPLQYSVMSKAYDCAKALVKVNKAFGLPADDLAVWERVQADKLPTTDEEGNEVEPKDVEDGEYQAALAAELLPDVDATDAGYKVKAIVKIGVYSGGRAPIEEYDKQFDTQVGDRFGFGVCLFPSGDVYVGEYGAGGLRDGLGVLRTKSGTTYVGSWKGGKRHGIGSMSYADGGVYAGMWAFNKRHGKGTFTYAAGDTYIGGWHAGTKHGAGKYMATEASCTYEGTWAHGTLQASKVIYSTCDSAAYYGAFDSAGRPTGAGAYAFGNGVSVKGSYVAPPIEEAEGDEPPPVLPSVWYGSEYGSATKASDAAFKKELTTVPPVFNVIIAGAPASGKGTQCEKIVAEYGLVHLSTGDMLRAAAADEGNELGQIAKEKMEAGELVPDELITSLVAQALDTPEVKAKGFLLDGYPRTANQAEEMAKHFLIPHKAILLDVPDEVLVQRVTGRRLDPETGIIYHLETKPPCGETEEETAAIMERLTQRGDDTEEALKVRLENFAANREAVASAFSAISLTVDGNRAPEEVWADIKAFITPK